MLKIFALCLCALLSLFILGCSDFYRKDFVHITSALQGVSEDKAHLEKSVQAMRKSQIMHNNQIRVLGITRYVNQIDPQFLDSEERKYQVFWVELYSKSDKLLPKDLLFTLSTAYKNIKPLKVVKLTRQELGIFAPDITYNDVYKVIFQSPGERGRDTLQLKLEIKGIGKMDFHYGYTKRKSNLTR